MIKQKIKKMLMWSRQLNRKERMLPALIIAGAQKAGATSLYEYLVQHPDIEKPAGKELHYFDLDYAKPFQWYRNLFPVKKEGKRTIEASPYYMFHPFAAERLQKHLPQVNIVLLLRNPIERAFSHYKHNVKKKREKRTLYQALRDEINSFESIQNSAEQERDIYAHRHFSYLHRGLYVQQIKNIYKYFSPENVLIIKSESFYKKPQSYLDQIYKRLHINPYQNSNLDVRNKGKGSSNIDRASLELMQRFYAQEQSAIIKLLGNDFDWGIRDE